jgi:hypothetical protein
MSPTRTLTIVAHDPGLTVGSGKAKRILTAEVQVPNEELDAGPRGYRVNVIDYDSSTDTLYAPLDPAKYGAPASPADPYRKPSDRTILSDPRFHAQNVYAVVMRTLARFESALGRRVSWSFNGHQLFVAPHAFATANAFYSKRDRALMFGYFPSPRTAAPIMSCLSHDVVVHETTHALLDGLRARYTDPSSPDQAAFHEGFADVVALLSAFSVPEVVGAALVPITQSAKSKGTKTVPRSALVLPSLRRNILASLAEQMGEELSGVRGNPLRRSVDLTPSTRYYLHEPEFEEPHRRGEILVAAVMQAFLRVLANAFASLGDQPSNGSKPSGPLDLKRVILEASDTANRLLNLCIRALDYTPPVHLRFGDFLSAALTSDHEIVPDDTRYGFRDALRRSFAEYGIAPTSQPRAGKATGLWEPPDETHDRKLDYSSVHFESMQQDNDEVFRFLWENRDLLKLDPNAYTRVFSVRPCHRIGPDGFILRETVVQYLQIVNALAQELKGLGIEKPAGMPDDTETPLYGGGTLIFGEYGRLKFHIRNWVGNAPEQTRRLRDLWRFGHFEQGGAARRSFAAMHMQKMVPWPLGLDTTEEV